VKATRLVRLSGAVLALLLPTAAGAPALPERPARVPDLRPRPLAPAQGVSRAAPPLDSLVMRLAEMTAVTGFEDAVAESLLALLPGSRRDAAGNVVWSAGGGEPVRVAVCPIDEPGHVVGGVTAEGYLTLRRAGRSPAGAPPERFLEGQRVVVFGGRGAVPGVVGVRSTHLQRGRPGAGSAWAPLLLEDAYVDLGAASAEEVADLGVGVTSPVARAKASQRYGVDRVAAARASSRAACAALLEAALELRGRGTPRATAVAAFTRRRYLDWDGAAFAIAAAARPVGNQGAAGRAVETVLLGDPAADDSLGSGSVAVQAGGADLFPDTRSVSLWSLPTRYAGSPIETVSLEDVAALTSRLGAFLGGADAPGVERESSDVAAPPAASRGAGEMLPAAPASATGEPAQAGVEAPAGETRTPEARLEEARAILTELVGTYGVSGSEGPVRGAVQKLLPGWAAPRTDAAGNLRLRVGSGAPLVVFVAHLDEVGYSVSAIGADGRLEIEPRGGFYGSLFEGEPALVHTARDAVPGVFALGVDSGAGASVVGDHPPAAPTRVDVGTGSRAATEALGIRAGDTVTMPKRLTRLAGARVSGRSLDDRVGCTALILALRDLDRGRLSHAVEFVWSIEEEVGLNGAESVARELAPERPARVHAVDTFVSSDAPLERRTFAYAPLGRGAVIRAVDDSAVAPPALVDSLAALASGLAVPLQVGATAGGNDGSAFTRYGVPDVAIGWPLRYSHSPAEVMDLHDLLALADVVRAVAERW
jgi:putative aminopeptidase FrvX